MKSRKMTTHFRKTMRREELKAALKMFQTMLKSNFPIIPKRVFRIRKFSNHKTGVFDSSYLKLETVLNFTS